MNCFVWLIPDYHNAHQETQQHHAYITSYAPVYNIKIFTLSAKLILYHSNQKLADNTAIAIAITNYS